MSELPSHLHLMAGLLESLLEGYYFYHVAGPRVYAWQLVGISEWFVPRHALTLGAVTAEDKAFSGTQQNHWQIDSQYWLEKVFQQVLDPGMGLEGPSIPGGEDTD